MKNGNPLSSTSKSALVPLWLFSLIPCHRMAFLLLSSIFQKPPAHVLPSATLIHSLFLLCSPSYKRCLRFRACQRVPVWQAGFFGFFPVFLLIRTICVCIGRTLFKSNSETAWLLSPKVPIISILPTGFCQNWVLSESLERLLCLLGNEIISKAGQEIVSALLSKELKFLQIPGD